MPEINTETLGPEPTINERVMVAATARGFELDTNGIDRIVGLTEHMPNNGAIFTENGLKISPPGLVQASGVPTKSTSWIDFMPQLRNDNVTVIFETTPQQRGKTTQITLMGIEAFQDFVLLADAGLVTKPERLFGITNPTMAKFAKRLGFEDTPALSGGVIADYDVVASNIFSSEMLDTQQRLKQRQATMAAVGSLALAH